MATTLLIIRLKNEDRSMNYENIRVETRGAVALVVLNRPKAFNALSNDLMDELTQALDAIEADEAIRAIVLTGGEKVFAAGADIKGMKDYSYMDAYKGNFITRNWERVSRCRKPVIAAVAGYALGGGCELAMMCDFILAADTAKFGQPEIKLGILPGAGGTQRLTRLVGKSKAMELCLTGRMMDAVEAERAGLVSRIVPVAELIEEAIKAAETIAGYSLPAVMMTKECINRSYETSLAEGLLFERRTFHAVFATEDQKEGMDAFAGKRDTAFKHR
jgi:enoyl-CoA hydratase